MITKTNYRVTAVTIIIHTFILGIGFNILAIVFEFPDILRLSADYRLTLFTENSSIIIPVYYLLALTGFTQITLSVFLHHLFDVNKSSLMMLATVFGILTGIFQVLGFIRWPIVVPYFASAMDNNVPMETIAFVEGMLNRYAGMAVGEHLGFVCQAAWTTLIGIIMVKHKLFSHGIGWAAVIIGLLSFPMSMEPLGGFLTIFGELSWPVNAAWNIWLVIVAISLFYTNEETQTGMAVGWKTAAISAVIWIIVVIPSIM
ncbi:MAG: DUF4386 family protein [Deltaproteobacteria bacterium]|jgi:hypothetical protein|nr:DUF4386 family protein [Deltaproteobacteria bacterium]